MTAGEERERLEQQHIVRLWEQIPPIVMAPLSGRAEGSSYVEDNILDAHLRRVALHFFRGGMDFGQELRGCCAAGSEAGQLLLQVHDLMPVVIPLLDEGTVGDDLNELWTIHISPWARKHMNDATFQKDEA